MSAPNKPSLYGKNHPANAPAPADSKAANGTAIDFLFDEFPDPDKPVVKSPEKTLKEARIASNVHLQAIGPAPALKGRAVRSMDVVCSKCLKTTFPKKVWAGSSTVTTIIAVCFPLLVAIILALLTRSDPHIDTDRKRIIEEAYFSFGGEVWVVSLLAALVPAVVYQVLRVVRAQWVCHDCGNPNIWPASSPVGLHLEAKRLAAAPPLNPLE